MFASLSSLRFKLVFAPMLPSFSFYDILLIICVSLFGTVSSFVRDPQIKAVFATLPVPFSLTWLAVGLPVDCANVVSMFLLLAYVHTTRIAHMKFNVPIIPSIVIGIALYVGVGALIAGRVPQHEWLFDVLCALSVLVGAIMLRTQQYSSGVAYRTPLHPAAKFSAIVFVVIALVSIKKVLQGFAPFFPTMNSVTSYEARHSLPTQCRQIPAFLVAAAPMLWIMRLFEVHLGQSRGVTLLAGVSLYLVVFLPINFWIRRQIVESQRVTK